MRWFFAPILMLSACTGKDLRPTPLSPDLSVPTSITQNALRQRSIEGDFGFLVAGHIYGDPSKTTTPADNFSSAISGLAATDADLLVCCGDTFRQSTAACFDRTVAVLEGLPFPTFNAVGNHDVAIRDAYVERFGKTYGAFVHGGCAFVLLDSEEKTWEISGQQLAFLTEVLNTTASREDVRAVFCFAHKLVFAHRQHYFEVLLGSNALDGLSRPNRFANDVLPLLKETASQKPVYWFGGDIGVAHTLATFYNHDAASGVTFVATGIGDLPRDSVVQVHVRGNEVSLSLLPLTDTDVGDIYASGIKMWSGRISPNGLPKHLESFRELLPK